MRQVVLIGLVFSAILIQNTAHSSSALKICNISKSQDDPNDRDVSQYPEQAIVMVDYGERCGGVILSKKFVLTAAECFFAQSKLAKFHVRAGAEVYDDKARFQEIEVSRIWMHPLSSEKSYDHNIAVVELSSDLVLDERYAWPATLPAIGSYFPDGKRVTLLSWGTDDSFSKTILRVTDVRLIEALCSAAMEKPLPDNLLCAGPDYRLNWKNLTCDGIFGEVMVAKKYSFLVIGIAVYAFCLDCIEIRIVTNLANEEMQDFILDVLHSKRTCNNHMFVGAV